MKGKLKALWLRVSGAIVCSFSLLLPYKPRFWFAKLLTWGSNPVSSSIGMSFQKQARFWNKIVLAFVFYLGFPLAKLFLWISGKRPLGKKKTAETFWHPRPTPESFVKDLAEPF